MFAKTFRHIQLLCQDTKDPAGSARAMHNLLTSSIKLSKNVATVNFLRKLQRLGVGTNDIETNLRRLQSRLVRKTLDRRVANLSMRMKIIDAEMCVKHARRDFYNKKTEYFQRVKRNSFVDNEFYDLMDSECTVLWKQRNNANKEKISWLVQKWRRNNGIPATETDVRGVKYRDEDLKIPVSDKNPETVEYGNVETTENMSEILKINPNMMTYEKVESEKIEMEIEKSFFKARYEFMKRNQVNKKRNDSGDKDDNNDDKDNENEKEDEEAVEENETLDLEKKTVDYSRMRATDLATCTRLIVPKAGTIRDESIMSGMKEKMLDEVNKYIKEECNGGGWPKTNLTRSEVAGMQELKNKVKSEEIVVFKSDKSGKLTVDSLENYSEAILGHTEADVEIGMEDVKKIEENMNDHLRQLNKIFNVGEKWNQQKRVAEASTSTNVLPPAFYGLRKDHKKVPDDRKEKGPPLRPICSAREAPNSRVSNFISKIIDDAADIIDDSHEVKSSEEMRADFEKYNREVSDTKKKKCKVLSQDMKALFPSIRLKTAKVSVKKLILRSKMRYENCDKWELAKFAAVVLTKEEIEENALGEFIPTRTKTSRRKLTLNCLKSTKADSEVWETPKCEPDCDQVRLLVALVVSHCVGVVMSNHTYKLGDKMFLQSDGGPIGLQATGAIARAYMMMYDSLYLEAAASAGIEILMYGRYIDDSNQIVVDDSESEDGENVAARLKVIANNLIEGLEIEDDLPSRHRNNKLPILDMKVHLDTDGYLIHEHYEKEVSSKLVISARSAHSSNSKRSVHISELVRRMLNTSRRLDWNEYVAPVLQEYMGRMMAAGYSEQYRENILRNAIAVYDSKVVEDSEGGTPLNRPNGYKKTERRKEKKKKRNNWGTKGGHIAPIIIPSTPGGELAKRLRMVAEKEGVPGLRFKVVERGGVTISRQLQKPNPTESPGCGERDCEVCRQPGGGSRCHKNNVTYRYICRKCGATYTGETARNLYSRSLEHKKNKNSFIRKHQDESHRGEEADFEIKVVGSYKDPLSRQVAEGVLITRCEAENLNSKAEFRQPPIVQVRKELRVGS